VPDTPEAMSPATMMRTISEIVPEDTLLYDESITSTEHLLFFRQPSRPGSYILGRGGCIGVGWPGAVGAWFARPDRHVVAPSGDGSAIFALQTLWTAAHYRSKVVFIVCDNHAYRILKVNILHYWRETGQPVQPFPFMDLIDPRVDFVRLAEGVGVPATSVVTEAALRAALVEALGREGPSLIDVQVNGWVNTE
jgi:thiamine pyrophosphate-dependent acetolactate synthase large subunit-like protein